MIEVAAVFLNHSSLKLTFGFVAEPDVAFAKALLPFSFANTTPGVVSYVAQCVATETLSEVTGWQFWENLLKQGQFCLQGAFCVFLSSYLKQ